MYRETKDATLSTMIDSNHVSSSPSRVRESSESLKQCVDDSEYDTDVDEELTRLSLGSTYTPAKGGQDVFIVMILPNDQRGFIENKFAEYTIENQLRSKTEKMLTDIRRNHDRIAHGGEMTVRLFFINSNDKTTKFDINYSQAIMFQTFLENVCIPPRSID